jgi:WD40 repeat protein
VTGKLQRHFALEGDSLMGPGLGWSPDGKAVALSCDGGPHGLFDPETGGLVRSLDTLGAGHVVSALAWSPNGKQVVTAGSQGVLLHDATSGKRTHTLDELFTGKAIGSLAWSPDGQRLAIGYNTADPLLLLEAATGQRRPAPPDAQMRVAWSPDGKTLAAIASEHTVGLWDATTNRSLGTLECGAPGSLPRGGLAWSADGKFLAGGGGHHLWVWSVETRKLLWQNDKQLNVSGLAWAPEGWRMATLDYFHPQAALRVWEGDTGKLVHEKPVRPWGWGLAWSPDGRTLAVADAGECLLIDPASGVIRLKVKGSFFCWSPNGKTLVTTGYPDDLRAWDTATGKELRAAPLSWPAEYTGNMAAAWSADARVLARSTGFEIHLCDADGLPLGVLLPGDLFGWLAVAADGHFRRAAPVEREIMIVAQMRDGSSATLTPAEFEQKYGWKNDPQKVECNIRRK